MSIEVGPETRPAPERSNQPSAGLASATVRETSDQQAIHSAQSTAMMWLKRFVAASAVVGVIALAIYLLTANSSGDDDPKLLHTIGRNDMIVSVTEQGTLESSDNTEIKCRVRGFSTVIWIIEGGQEVKEGDVLARLDTKSIEDAISLQTTNAHEATATLERTKANVAKAEIAIDAYLEGDYRKQMQDLQRQKVIAQANLDTANQMLAVSELMFKRGYVTALEVEGNAFTVKQAELELNVTITEIDVLERFTKEMRLETLRGNLAAARAKLEADKAGLEMDAGRRDRALEELEYCVITAPRDGLVIYPSAAAWKRAPDVSEGATVRRDQVLLLMPDLAEMQVKVGIHESIIDKVKPGLVAKIMLGDTELTGRVKKVSPVTRPAGWWTGNVVKYDTIIELPQIGELKPGMSAEVELILSEHEDILTIPVAAVLETIDGHFCWVNSSDGVLKRAISIGASNDVFIEVKGGLKEGDQVVLNPLAYVEDASEVILKPAEEERLMETLGQGDNASSSEREGN